MQRLATLATTVAAAAVAVSGFAVPAHAEAVVYENHTVTSNPPNRPGNEYASLDIPTGYMEDRFNWHTTAFVEQVDQGRTIIVDLHPKADTVRELKNKRARLMESDTYREFAFKVNDKDSKVRVRWSFTYSEPGTGDVDPFVSVMLMSGNHVTMVGKLDEREQIRSIREHIRASVVFPS